ncbi:aldo/keto reductase, partial [Escherichia coli]|nr:aldo/keto reductase [Escherichia coli]MJE16340.1 aldo/keto reductase [Escherichia coli]
MEGLTVEFSVLSNNLKMPMMG